LPPDWQKRSYPSTPFPWLQHIKRKVFISYHHERDQFWFDYFTKTFSDDYEVFQDQSLDDEVESEDLEYVNRVIRQDYIVGSSITMVLCGAETWKRRFVDWEIASTLHHEHALLGIIIPGTSPSGNGKFVVPDRLHDNIESGYAGFGHWPKSPGDLKTQIEATLGKSLLKFLIRNERSKMRRNRT
jgi:antiphage defense system Thoeris ThsB-like protein